MRHFVRQTEQIGLLLAQEAEAEVTRRTGRALIVKQNSCLHSALIKAEGAAAIFPYRMLEVAVGETAHRLRPLLDWEEIGSLLEASSNLNSGRGAQYEDRELVGAVGVVDVAGAAGIAGVDDEKVAV